MKITNEKIQKAGLQAMEDCNRLLINDGFALPKDAYLTGQAFASLLMKHLGFWDKHIFINDIDVMKVAKYYNEETEYNKMFSRWSEPRKEVQSDGYGHTWIGSGAMQKYRVVETVKCGIMNVTNIQFSDKISSETNLGQELINRFDINSTQAAINTTTKEVVVTDTFLRFCKTHVLAITDMSTIGHSMIRLVKKSKDHGLSADWEKEFAKGSIRVNGVDGNHSKCFGERLYGIYEENKDFFFKMGFVAEPYDFEGRKFPLFVLSKVSSLLSEKKMKRVYEDLNFEDLDIVREADYFYHLSDNEYAAEVERLTTFFLKGSPHYKNSLDSWVSRFYTDSLFTLLEYKKVMKIEADDEVLGAFLFNNSTSFSDVIRWIEVLESKLYTPYIREQAMHQLNEKRLSSITLKEVLENKSPFILDEFLAALPKIGESNNQKSKIYGEVDGILLVEAEQTDETIELFGVTSNEGELVWQGKTVGIEDFYSIKTFSDESWIIDGDKIEIQGSKEILQRVQELREEKSLNSESSFPPSQPSYSTPNNDEEIPF